MEEIVKKTGAVAKIERIKKIEGGGKEEKKRGSV